MKVFLAVVLAGLCLTVDAIAVLAASVPPVKIVITPASFSEREGLLIVTQNQGYFRKRNLDVQLVLMPSAPIAFSALTAGESHFYYGTTSGTSLGAVLNGLDGVFVAGFINKLVGAFAVSKEIKTPNDLKGKQIGVASLGGGNWMFTMRRQLAHIPGAQFIVLPEAAHSINWEQPEAFNRNVLEFIRRH